MNLRRQKLIYFSGCAVIIIFSIAVVAALSIWSTPHRTTAVRLIPAAETLGTSTAASLCSTEGKYCNVALLQLINAERKAHNEPAYALSSILSYGTSTCIGARGHARHMAAVGQISHDQFSADICLPFGYAAENVGYAGGGKWAAVQTVFALMEQEPWTPGCSGSHHCAFLSLDYRLIGLGFAQGSTGYWFQSEEFTG